MKIKVAQIGTSRFSHGTAIWQTLERYPEIFEIVGYALPEGERERFAKEVAAFDGSREMTVEEILQDPTIDAVIVETEEIYLTKYAQMVADAGKHMHMEKPGGLSLEAFEKLIGTVKTQGTVFHTGYMYRYNPVIRDVLRRVKAGEIGEIVSVEAQMNCWHKEECTRWLSTFEGGMMFFLGCHLLDLIIQLQGFPNKVHPFHRSSGRFDGADSRDCAFAVLEYDRGVSFLKASAAEWGGYLRRQLVITGTRGSIEVNPLERSPDGKNQYTDYVVCPEGTGWNTPGEHFTSPSYGRYDEMMLSFAAMVRGEQRNPVSYDYELELFRTLKKCCE
ncbi:MAG: Gfo/Idh/MocA family oxidoreductase [Clostridia bacterium]|nr:Gfo/Idh/MocA family oxidoreductase [Clostridia bacterium]